MKIKASSVHEYLNNIPEERKATVNKLRKAILDNLPNGYKPLIYFLSTG